MKLSQLGLLSAALISGLVACHVQKKATAEFPSVATSEPAEGGAQKEKAGSFDQMPEQTAALADSAAADETTPSKGEDEDSEVAPKEGEVTPEPMAAVNKCKSKECEKRREGMAAYYQANALHRKGQFDQALSLYLKACQYGVYRGCHRYGWHMQQSGNERNAEQFFNTSCKQGVERSCNNLGFMAEQRGDLNNAKDYYASACIHGSKGGCSSLQRVYKVLYPNK